MISNISTIWNIKDVPKRSCLTTSHLPRNLSFEVSCPYQVYHLKNKTNSPYQVLLITYQRDSRKNHILNTYLFLSHLYRYQMQIIRSLVNRRICKSCHLVYLEKILICVLNMPVYLQSQLVDVPKGNVFPLAFKHSKLLCLNVFRT